MPVCKFLTPNLRLYIPPSRLERERERDATLPKSPQYSFPDSMVVKLVQILANSQTKPNSPSVELTWAARDLESL